MLQVHGMGFGPQGQGVGGHYNPDDPASVYTNPSIHTRISEYTTTGRQVHGPEWDRSAHPIDGDLVMRVGGGKKHGRYFIGDGTLDTASTPTLAQIRARSTSSSPAICPRQSTMEIQMEALNVISVTTKVY